MSDINISEEMDFFSPAKDQLAKLLSSLMSEQVLSNEIKQVEELVELEGAELLRLILQGYLDIRSNNEERYLKVIGNDGVERTHCRERSRTLMSIFGEVALKRLGYSKPEVPSCFPLDEDLNLPPDKYSPGIRRRVARTASKSSFDEVVDSIDKESAGHIPKRQAEELSRSLTVDFEAFYGNKGVPSSNNNLLVLSTDGKGIVVRHEDLREATRKAAENSNHKISSRLSKGEKRNRKRMATVAAVYDTEQYIRTAESIMGKVADEMVTKRPKPSQKRVWASVEHGSETVIEQMFEEALRRDPERQRTWIMLVDGLEDQIRKITRVSKKYNPNIIVIQDFIHVLEYLWKAAYCFHDSGTDAAEKWVMQHALKVLDGKASRVAAGMRCSATRKELSEEERKAVDKCASYLLKNKKRLDYATALKNGWPIATGVIEGACRYLVKDRMDITGARWSLAGAEAVLRLRAMHSVGDLDEYLNFHQRQERMRNYANDDEGFMVRIAA